MLEDLAKLSNRMKTHSGLGTWLELNQHFRLSFLDYPNCRGRFLQTGAQVVPAATVLPRMPLQPLPSLLASVKGTGLFKENRGAGMGTMISRVPSCSLLYCGTRYSKNPV